MQWVHRGQGQLQDFTDFIFQFVEAKIKWLESDFEIGMFAMDISSKICEWGFLFTHKPFIYPSTCILTLYLPPYMYPYPLFTPTTWVLSCWGSESPCIITRTEHHPYIYFYQGRISITDVPALPYLSVFMVWLLWYEDWDGTFLSSHMGSK